MLSEKERKFISYWEANRDKQKGNTRQFVIGLSIGLSMGTGIVFLIASGWYARANMVANSKLSPIIFAAIIIAIAVFMAYLYRNHLWDMREQQYKEFLAKKRKEEKMGNDMQQQAQ